ncbi:MAG: MopE-related protein [Myxococcota bacterium]
MIALVSIGLAAEVCPSDSGIVGCATLTEAIAAAAPDATTMLDLAPGVYREPVTITGNRDIVILGGIAATFAPSASDPEMQGRDAQFEVVEGRLEIRQSTLAPVNLGAVYAMPGTEIVLREIAVAPSGAGWGLWLEGSTGRVEAATFVGGVAFQGAHVFANDADLTLASTDFLNGVAVTTGGSVLAAGDSTLFLSDCTFSANQATSGGALAVVGGTTTISRSHFNANVAQSRGGAVFVADGSAELVIDTTDFQENDATDGGAVYLGGARAEVRVSSFCQNRASGTGGAVHSGSADDAVMTNLRFLDNVATWGGAVGVRSEGMAVSHANFLGNRASRKGAAVYVATGSGLSVHESIVAHSFGSVAVSADDGALAVVTQNVLHFGNEVGNTDAWVEKIGEVLLDPQLRGYLPGQACGLFNDQHALLSPPAARADTVEASGPELSCLSPATEDGGFVIDVRPDWGAYGGTCGFPRVAWVDTDFDGYPALYDCDDSDSSIHPLGEEIWYDGIDQNCDGANDFDQDGDGWELGGNDCDDEDPSRNRFVVDDDPFRDLNCDLENEQVAPVLQRERVACSVGPVAGGWVAFFAVVLARRRR